MSRLPLDRWVAIVLFAAAGLTPLVVRDVFILDSRNQVYAVFNLTQHDLADPQNREQIKSLFLDAARIVDTDHDGLPER